MTNFTFDIYSILPEAYLLSSTFLLLIYGVLLSVSYSWGYPLILVSTGILSTQILLFTIILILSFPCVNFISWNFFLISNFYVFSFKLFITIITIIWIIFSISYLLSEKINSFEYWIFILITISALFFILQSCDLLMLYLVIELQSLSFYVLASFKRSSEFSTEAGLKYFILGAFSSAFLLFGSSIIYGLTGITNFSDLSLLLAGSFYDNSIFSLGIFIGLSFIISALFFKLGASPFHMWVPDVYEGSPTSTTAFFALMPKIVILTLLARLLMISFYDLFYLWKPFFIVCAFLSLLFGTFGAFIQKKWKRFLAYSSINHIGFILIGFTSGETFGFISVISYLIIYIITTCGIFALLINLKIYKYPQKVQVRYIIDIKNLAYSNPLLAGSLTLILFSMAGIPPLAGFFAKVFVILTGIQSNSYSLVIFSVVMSSIACFYYIRIIQSIYFLKLKQWSLVIPMYKSSALILGTSCILIILLFLDIELFSILITRVALSFSL